MEIKNWWVNLTFACGLVTTTDNIITGTMPILYKFIGQPMINLTSWNKYIEHKEI